MNQSIKEIAEELKSISTISDPRIERWRLDSRKGVSKLIEAFERNIKAKELLRNKFVEMSSFEEEAKHNQYKFVAGIDEVGRGPLAGPGLAAAVILPSDFYLPGLDDSKRLSSKSKKYLYEEIQAHALAIGIGIATAKEIDTINIYQATKLAMVRAVENSKVEPDYLLIDAMTLDVTIPQQSIVQGDSKSISIAAASIIAKVTRDHIMEKLSEKFPYYKFEKNAGYGTREHLDGLEHHGICEEHRVSFAPIRNILNKTR